MPEGWEEIELYLRCGICTLLFECFASLEEVLDLNAPILEGKPCGRIKITTAERFYPQLCIGVIDKVNSDKDKIILINLLLSSLVKLNQAHIVEGLSSVLLVVFSHKEIICLIAMGRVQLLLH